MVVTGGARLVVLTGVVGGVVALARPALGQAGATERTFSLEYRGSQACPDAAALSEAIKVRSAHSTEVDAAAAAVQLTVEILENGHSSLWVDLPQGSFRREFQSPSCVEAVESVALMAAMVLDAAPEVRRAMTQFPADAPAPGVDVDEASTTDTPGVVAEPVTESPPLVAPPAPSPAKRAAPVPPKPRAPPLVWRAGVGGGIETAVAPSPPLGLTLGVESWRRSSSFWSPSIRLGLFATATATQQVAAGDGRFRLLTGHLRLCPTRWSFGNAFRLLPCVQVEAGALTASGGGGPANTQRKSMPWFAGGPSVRAELDLVGPIALEGGAEMKGLARHDRFVFRTFSGDAVGPDSPIYRVPLLSLGFQLGILLRLP